MVALVRKSPAREPGRFSSSAMRWVIRACNLKEQTQRVVISQKKSFFCAGTDGENYETSKSINKVKKERLSSLDKTTTTVAHRRETVLLRY